MGFELDEDIILEASRVHVVCTSKNKEMSRSPWNLVRVVIRMFEL